MKKIKYGVLSTANVGSRFINAIKESDMGSLHAVSSRDINKAKVMAEKYGNIKYYGSYEEICKDCDIDVIYVPTINKAHFDNVNLALDNNKHVVCEKPITLSENHTKKLFKKAKSKNLFLMEAQKSVFLPVTLKAKELIFSGEIGEIKFLDYKIFPGYPDFKWFFDRESGGGAITGSVSYIIHHSEFLLDSKVENYSGHSTYRGKEIDFQTNMNFKFENEVLLNGVISVLVKEKSMATIYGSKGKIEITDFWKADTLKIIKNTDETEIFNFPFNYEMVYEVNHINECIKKGLIESPVMTREMSLRGSKITENLRKVNINID
ncbi:MAG: Gfo/Idh/MocA family oxidoreductase [Clostridium sp.]|nr:Gfo/Idh/MocA family oxidoreductase [Clostridium sp.]